MDSAFARQIGSERTGRDLCHMRKYSIYAEINYTPYLIVRSMKLKHTLFFDMRCPPMSGIDLSPLTGQLVKGHIRPS